MKPSGTPNKGNRAKRALRAIGNTQGWARACTNFQDLGEFAEKLFFKGVLGQSSLPIWLPGTLEFIWAGRIPLNPHQKIISLQNYLFQDPKITPKTSPGQNVDLGVPKSDPGLQNLTSCMQKQKDARRKTMQNPALEKSNGAI